MNNFAEGRTGSLLEPIMGNDLPFFIEDDSIIKQLKSLSGMINRGAYGCYLISGERGVGKSSVINAVLESMNGAFCKPQIKFSLSLSEYDEEDGICLSIISNLYSRIPSDELFGEHSPEEILWKYKDRIKDLYKNFMWEREENKFAERAESSEDEHRSSTKNEESVGISVKCFIGFIKGSFFANKEKTRSRQASTSNKHTIEQKKRQPNLHLKLKNLLRDISSEMDIFIIFDELDKKEDAFLETIFDNYKDLLLESRIFSFLICDRTSYGKYGMSDESSLSTYFAGLFYLCRMSYSDTLRYCYTVLNITDLVAAKIFYYKSLGNKRKINNMYLRTAENENKKVVLHKLILLQELTAIFSFEYADTNKNNYDKDILEESVKYLIEKLFDKRKSTYKELEKIFTEKCSLEYPKFLDIWSKIQSLSEKTLWLEIVGDNNIIINFGKMKADVCCDKEVEPEAFYYQPKRMAHNDIILGYENCNMIKLGDNDCYAYENVLEKLVLGNLHKVKAVILIVQKMADTCFGVNAENYSMAVMIENIYGRKNVFYNEKGGYSFEGWSYIYKIKKIFNEYNFDVHCEEITDDMTIEDGIRRALKKISGIIDG